MSAPQQEEEEVEAPANHQIMLAATGSPAKKNRSYLTILAWMPGCQNARPAVLPNGVATHRPRPLLRKPDPYIHALSTEPPRPTHLNIVQVPLAIVESAMNLDPETRPA
ncbi:hypothetical protein G7054_g14217 [Neopestalotiopsis clavispora]|nr:hypothetical protein G7054_g14217 [Neopestalotiopsis clavispora]